MPSIAIAPKPAGLDRRRRAVRELEGESCRARMARDYRAAERIIETRRALNDVTVAQRRLAVVDPDLADALFDGVILADQPITMTALQFFVALAHRYATNEQLAEFLYGALTERNAKKKLGAIRAVFQQLRAIPDEEWAAMDQRARPR